MKDLKDFQRVLEIMADKLEMIDSSGLSEDGITT